LEKVKGRYQVGEADVDDRIILKYIYPFEAEV
jgi:hypothetical protein